MSFFFFFNDTATTEIYTLSLHDALPISSGRTFQSPSLMDGTFCARLGRTLPCWSYTVSPAWNVKATLTDRKSTRLNSSHDQISYAVFCLKKKKNNSNNSK